tara:strand:- start:1 stop:756 length:756 start_codon:yes stop_codon:yes gene_type:complete
MEKLNFHKVKWDSEKINNFWNFETSTKINQEDWFAFQFSGALKKFIKSIVVKHIKSKKVKYLDYGAGKGFLLEKFVDDKRIQFSGSEFGTDALKILDSKFQKKDNYLGTVNLNHTQNLKKFENTFDLVTMIEVIEHLTDEFYDSTFKIINNLLKSNGLLIITTPNDEDLSKKEVYCPDCGCVFHRVQHVKSFNVKSISKSMKQFGFEIIDVKEMDLATLKKRNLIKNILYKIKSQFVYAKKPHLVCVVKKI